MRKVSLIILVLIALKSFQVTGQTGNVKGEIYKIEQGEKESIPFAQIINANPNGHQLITKSQIDGTYMFSLPAGEYDIIIKSSGLQVDTVAFKINAGETIIHNHELMMKTFDRIVITGKVKADGGSVVAAVEETKKSDGIIVVQTASQMEDKGAGDVDEGAKKMTGLSSVGSVLYVRGLGDRYNVAYLNGLPIPSPNPDFRVVPLSIFPTDIVSSVQVSKVMSSEYYGDFSGGAFNITTKSFYNNPTLKVSIGTGANSQTTFNNFRTYNGGKYDFFGIDDGTRQLPEYVIANSKGTNYAGVNDLYNQGIYNSVEGKTTGFRDNFGTFTKKAPVSTSFSITAGQFFPTTKSKDKSKGLGFLALISQDNNYQYSNGSMKIINAQSEDRLNYEFEKYEYTTASTGLLNIYLRINPNNNISLNSLVVNNSSDMTTETWGKHFDYVRNIYSRRLSYKQNYMNVNQLIGTHKLFIHKEDQNFARLLFDWRGSVSFTGSQEPDRRQFVAFYDAENKNDTEHYAFNYIDRNENHIFYSKLTEQELAGKINAVYVIKYNDEKGSKEKVTVQDLITLKIGADYKSKTRLFDYKQFNYVINQLGSNIGDNLDIYNIDNYLNSEIHDKGEFYIQEVANFGSSYVAKLDVSSAYADMKFRLKNLELIPGVRYENGYQSVENRNQQSPINLDKTVLLSNDFLPSLLTKLAFNNDTNIFRFTASKTLTRPKFNEVAPFQYTLYFAGVKAQGNTELQNGINYNADFRYERYARPGEMVSIGAFYKYLDNPIEQTMQATASGQLMSFANANSATVAGVEVEFIKSLDFLARAEVRDSSLLKYFGVGFNASYLYSQVSIDSTDGGAINTNNIRPLEGASPYLVNIDFRFQRELGEDAKMKNYLFALSYNVFGPRLFAVGSNGIGDQYERPINSLNFVGKIAFNDTYTFGIKAKNLLNPSNQIVQENRVDGGFLEVSTFKRGVDLSLSFSYNIPVNRKNKRQ